MKEENGLLSQLQRVQELFEELKLENLVLKEQSKRDRSELFEVLEEVKAEKGKNTVYENELAALNEALASERVAFKSVSSKKRELELAYEKEKAERVRLQKRVDEISEIKKDRDLVFKQLQLVQEQLELENAKSIGLGNKLEDHKAQIQQKNKKLQILSRRKKEAVSRLAESQEQISLLSRKVHVGEPVHDSRDKKSSFKLGFIRRKRLSVNSRKDSEMELIRNSKLFDANWYLSTYADVEASGVDPVEHYCEHGVADLRNPSPYFSTEWYLTAYPDVAKENINPLVHYLSVGQSEGRSTGRGNR